MIISKKVYTDVLSLRHVSANGWASACRGGKSIVFFMECLILKKKEEEKKKKITSSFSFCPRILCELQVALKRRRRSDAVPASLQLKVVYRTQAYVFFRRRSKGEDALKLSRKCAVPDDCYTLSLLHSSQNFLSQTEKSLKCVVHKKDEDAKACRAGKKKSASRI